MAGLTLPLNLQRRRQFAITLQPPCDVSPRPIVGFQRRPRELLQFVLDHLSTAAIQPRAEPERKGAPAPPTDAGRPALTRIAVAAVDGALPVQGCGSVHAVVELTEDVRDLHHYQETCPDDAAVSVP